MYAPILTVIANREERAGSNLVRYTVLKVNNLPHLFYPQIFPIRVPFLNEAFFVLPTASFQPFFFCNCILNKVKTSTIDGMVNIIPCRK